MSVHLISFARFDAQPWNAGCAFDHFTDAEIRDAEPAANVSGDWRECLAAPPPSWDAFHLGRIKALALAIMAGKPVTPVKAYFYPGSTCNCIGDGHHRLRALRYAGATEFPAVVEGVPEMIEGVLGRAET